MTDFLVNAYPALAGKLRKVALANLPTPLGRGSIPGPSGLRDVGIKYDNLTSSYYGGNKLRKLEYLLQRAIDKCARRVATFGSVASNHALATALYAQRLDLGCTCLLSHQVKSPAVVKVLRLLMHCGAEIVPYGGDSHSRVQTMRHHVQGRRSWVIPLGGSSWLGAVGYVGAGLELADQVNAGVIEAPARIYIATGTMGSAGGLALGLALAGLPGEVHAVRVSPEQIMNRTRLDRLMAKTALMLNRLDPGIPADLHRRARVQVRHEFYGDGYARSNPATDAAIAVARDSLGLELESTYTGKAMAALLHDAGQSRYRDASLMFWNTYNSNPLPDVRESDIDLEQLPAEFLRYFD
ncbi:MAG: pyridoxal-phosphate dependent enzyme [Gammaproteobacteria bacterium]|jgi:D-cysteine desulfhydrase|nr:pyridoxal-phosphate dependent enzyme [Gammaproteobacteria bacterium]